VIVIEDYNFCVLCMRSINWCRGHDSADLTVDLDA